MPSYHFPPPEPDPGYGYNNQPLLASQQWSQPGDGQGYELNYQSYAADPSPFARAGHLQPQGYGQHDVDYGDEFYEDEEPRRGKRWLLIAAALVGAIGVGGALAYTYRSLVAPNSRVPVVRADPNVKVKPEQRGGRDLAAADKKLPTRPAEEAAPAAAEEPPAESHGPRAVKTIPIAPGGPATPAPPPVVAAPAVPGITMYKPPQAAVPAPPPVQPAAKAPSMRAVMDTRTPPPAETEDDDPPTEAPPPVKRQTALAAPPKAPPAVAPKAAQPAHRTPSSGSGEGFVAVVSSQKTRMDAMKAYADLQQTYPDVLGEKSFDVQEADLSAKGLGTMYRVVVGPPGSRNAASSVCAQLKTAGHAGCWVKEW